MIKVEYSPTHTEVVNTTLDFLMNRPVLTMLFLFMKLSCILLCCGFAITLYTGGARPQDYAGVAFALLWLRFYKTINKKLISRSLNRRTFSTRTQSFNIDKQRIFYKDSNNNPVHITWNKVKFLLKSKDGYILPLTGITNAGKFLWFPTRGFEADSDNQFVDLLAKVKVKVKEIK